MAARVFELDELATRITAYLLTISPRTTVALALTCRAVEVPVLRTLWEVHSCSLSHLIVRVLPTNAWCYIFPESNDLCLVVRLLFVLQPFRILIRITTKTFSRSYSDRSLHGS